MAWTRRRKKEKVKDTFQMMWKGNGAVQSVDFQVNQTV